MIPSGRPTLLCPFAKWSSRTWRSARPAVWRHGPRRRSHAGSAGTGAASRRRTRRRPGRPNRPTPASAMPAGNYIAPALPRPRYGWLLSRWGSPSRRRPVFGAGAGPDTQDRPFHVPAGLRQATDRTLVMALPDSRRRTAVLGGLPVARFGLHREDHRCRSHRDPRAATAVSRNCFPSLAKGRSAKDIVAALVKRTPSGCQGGLRDSNAMVGYRARLRGTGRRLAAGAGPTAASALWSWRR